MLTTIESHSVKDVRVPEENATVMNHLQPQTLPLGQSLPLNFLSIPVKMAWNNSLSIISARTLQVSFLEISHPTFGSKGCYKLAMLSLRYDMR